MTNRTLCRTATLFLSLFSAALASGAQSPADKRIEFEVASIKPANSGEQRMGIRMQSGGRFTASGIPVKFLIEQAYGVKDSQISGAPGWIDSERYDIDAKMDDADAATFDKLPPDQRMSFIGKMLQALLTDRFKLSLSHETKDLPVYALIVAKNGPKIQESTSKPPEKMPDSPPPGPDKGGQMRQGIMMNGRGELTVKYVDLPMFCNVLSRIVGRIVLDKTGLTGKYDFNLKWTPEEGEGPKMPGGPPPGSDANVPPPDSSGPSIFTALQEQLGLKLDSQKAPTDVLVIERIERPTEN